MQKQKSTVDVFSPTKRSEVMSRIRSSGNKETELALIAFLREAGIVGWRRNVAIYGKPDFVFRQFKLAVFVDGCFWHGCPDHGSKPKNNAAWWARKFEQNRARDRRVQRHLETGGWTVVRVWEHENPQIAAVRIQAAIGPGPEVEPL